MKPRSHVIVFLLVYMLIAFAACLCHSFLMLDTSTILDDYATKYKMISSLLLFFSFLPSIYLSGSLVSFSWIFGHYELDYNKKTKYALFDRLRTILTISLICVIGLFLINELLYPYLTNYKDYIEKNSFYFEEYQTRIDQSLKKEDYFSAEFYVKQSLTIQPDSKELQKILGDIESFKESEKLKLSSLNIQHQSDSKTELNIFLEAKQDAYNLFENKNYLESYYLFKRLDTIYSHDTEVFDYLTLLENKLSDYYFFDDEISELKDSNAADNIRFSCKNTIGGKDVIYIKNIVIAKHGKQIFPYMNGFSFIRYNQNNTVITALSVPYAKIVRKPAFQVFSEQELKTLNLRPTQTVPSLILTSINRDIKKVSSEPIYDKKNYSKLASTQLNLCLAYEDFSNLCNVSRGLRAFPLVPLVRFALKADLYGYSKEIYLSSVIYRLFYPILLFIFSILYALVAWKYRLPEAQIFKSWWVILMPLCTALIHLLYKATFYFFKLFNYFMISTIGFGAIPLVLLLCCTCIFFVIYLFISQKVDDVR